MNFGKWTDVLLTLLREFHPSGPWPSGKPTLRWGYLDLDAKESR